MNYAISIFKNCYFKEDDQERHMLYEEVFSGKSIIKVVSSLGLIPSESFELMSLLLERDMINHGEYRILHKRFVNRPSEEVLGMYGWCAINNSEGGHLTALWFDNVNKIVYHYDPQCLKRARKAEQIIGHIFYEWKVVGTDKQYLVQRQKVIKEGKSKYIGRDYFCIWWSSFYISNRTKGYSHEESCHSAEYSALFNFIIKVCINYRKLLK